jgi:PAS domain S-box-containing protein
MTNNEPTSSLRQRAEDIVREKRVPSADTIDALSPEETRRILHELRVHQIELEMQNEELRRAQSELNAERARYFDLYDFAPVGYMVLSEKGLILESNLTAATLLGVPRGAMVQQPISRFVIDEDHRFFYHHINQLFKTGEQQACELRMLKKDRVAFWARIETTAAHIADGDPVCRVVMSDITERKQAEESLRESESRLHEVLENSLDSSYKRNLQTNSYDYLSPVFARISGYAPEEMKALPVETVLALTHPDDLADIERVIAESMGGTAGMAYQLEYRFKHKNGHYRWFLDRFTVLQDPQGKPLARIGSVSDITERKQAQEALHASHSELEKKVLDRTAALRQANQALHQSEERYRKVVDNLNEGLWLLDRDARTTFANPRLAEMLGFTPDEMMGRTLFSFMDEAGVSRCREYLDRHPQNIRETCDFELLRKDGSRLCTSLSTAQILDERGRYAGVVAGVMDITERLALEREILNVGKREQRRIGEDLHDGLGQQLTGIELMCSSLHDDLCATQPKLKDQTAKMGSFLREAIRQTRLLAHDSIGFNLSAHGLPIALAEFAKNISSMGRVQCGFHCPSPVSFDNPDIVRTVF